ncbi:MAG: hypothetical protein JRG97_00400 [Deltaproteobacteria bacterium]|nr:hypothetical protein [Deltaproteobacteria bacterium]
MAEEFTCAACGKEFTCAACGKEYEGDAVTGVTECRVCRRMHCDGCLDELVRCAECAEEEEKESSG